MKNELKKPLVIRTNIDLDHLEKVKKARKKEDYIRYKCTVGDKIAFKLACKEIDGMNESEVSRALMIAFTEGKIELKKKN